MKTIHTTSHVGSDGVLRIDVPVGITDADVEVTVVVEPLNGGIPPAPDAAAWREFIDSTAGCWQGEPLVRPKQGDFEQREAWDDVSA